MPSLNTLYLPTLVFARVGLRSLVLVWIGFLIAMGDAHGESSIQPLIVATKPARVNTLLVRVKVAATAQGVNDSQLSAQTTGRVVAIKADVGAQVAVGQSLVELDNPAAQSLLKRAQSSLRAAESEADFMAQELDRFTSLWLEKAISKQEFEAVKNRYQGAKARLESAQAEVVVSQNQFAELTLRAPFAGVVTALFVDAGDVLMAGQPMLRLSDPTSVEARLSVAPDVVQAVTQGDKVLVRSSTSAGESVFEGVIKHVAPFSQGASLPQVIVALPAKIVSPGMPLEFEMTLPPIDGFAVPLQAIFRVDDARTGVYVVNQGRAELRLVVVKKILDSGVIVTGDLSADAAVVVNGRERVFDGAPVEVLE